MAKSMTLWGVLMAYESYVRQDEMAGSLGPIEAMAVRKRYGKAKQRLRKIIRAIQTDDFGIYEPIRVSSDRIVSGK